MFRLHAWKNPHLIYILLNHLYSQFQPHLHLLWLYFIRNSTKFRNELSAYSILNRCQHNALVDSNGAAPSGQSNLTYKTCLLLLIIISISHVSSYYIIFCKTLYFTCYIIKVMFLKSCTDVVLVYVRNAWVFMYFYLYTDKRSVSDLKSPDY